MPLQIAIDSTAPGDWNEFVRPFGRFYHRMEWCEALHRQFGFGIHYLSARQDGSIVGVLPLATVRSLAGRRRVVSLPFSYAAGPLALSAEADAALCAAARELCESSGARTLELKRRDPGQAAPDGFHRVSHYLTYVVSTAGGADAVWKKLHPSHVQRAIRKGMKSVTVERGTDRAAWARMAELQQRTSRRLGLPAPPDDFFVTECATLQRHGLAELLLARVPEAGDVAGVVLWKGGRETIYAFGASLPEYLDRKPNHALLWTALQDATREGVSFDLGRAAPEQGGLTQFKLRWGGEPHPLAYDYWPAPSGLNTMSRDRGALAMAGRLWSRLPLPLTRRASFLYRYLG
ncbi:MAG TPA: GNAT family N-acetyltransferase [Gemmatimonadaceae bacterium]|nr:GNAT family N-acetyltransferase [Gemmatimonadaceae bacterium]